MSKATFLAGLIMATALSISACSGTSTQTSTSSDSSSTTTQPSDESSTSEAASSKLICDQAALGAVMNTKQRDERLIQLTAPQCADGWAVATAIYLVPDSGNTTVQSVVVFQETETGWTQQDREGSCQAEVIPESLRAAACPAP